MRNYLLMLVYYNPALCDLAEWQYEWQGTAVLLEAYLDNMMVYGFHNPEPPIPGYDDWEQARAGPNIIYGVVINDLGPVQAVSMVERMVTGIKAIFNRN